MEYTKMEILDEDENNSCRLCKENGDIDIYENSFIPYAENENVKLIDAYSLMASFNEFEVIDQEQILRIMCHSCVDELIIAYNFVLKIKQYDGRFFNNEDDFSEKFLEKSEKNSLSSPSQQQENHQSNYHETTTTTENETIVKELNESINSTPENTKKNIVIISDEIIHNNEEILKTKDKDLKFDELNNKRQKLCPDNIEYDLSDVVVPKFVLTKQIVNRLEDFLLDPGVKGDVNSMPIISFDHDPESTLKRTILTLDIEMISLNNVNFDEIDDIVDIEGNGGDGRNGNCDDTTMYMCKYCPKAFAGCYHLLIHTRRSHVCQFCVEGFPGTQQLHEHIRNDHKSFKCQICRKEFKANGNLRSHIRKTHHINLPIHVSLLVISPESR